MPLTQKLAQDSRVVEQTDKKSEMVLTSISALAEWPERSIELIVPANPGGDTDANARALAAALNMTWCSPSSSIWPPPTPWMTP